MSSEEIIIPVLGILLPIILTLGAYIMLVFMRKYKNIERMAMIEKGLSPDLFKEESRTGPPMSLRWSLLLIGIGIGFLLGYWLDRQFYMEETGYFSMLFIWGGLGLGAAYMVEERKTRKDS
jgi:hypothetical protein